MTKKALALALLVVGCTEGLNKPWTHMPESDSRDFRTDREIACENICTLSSDDDQYECLRDCLNWGCDDGD